jgi:helix-turn-helix protein
VSVHVLSWVLRHSDTTLADRLVLLVLADHAKEDGTASWPSVATIAREARLSERQAQYSLRALEDSGAIVQTGRSRSGTHIYEVAMEGGADSAGVQNSAEGGAHVAPEPSLEQPSIGEEPNGSSRAPRAKNLIWEALSEVFGEPTTRTSQRLRGKVCSSLAHAGATHEEILKRARSWPRHFDDATLTETALEKHWDVLGRKPLRRAG